MPQEACVFNSGVNCSFISLFLTWCIRQNLADTQILLIEALSAYMMYSKMYYGVVIQLHKDILKSFRLQSDTKNSKKTAIFSAQSRISSRNM